MKKLYTFAIALLAATACLFLLPTETQAAAASDLMFALNSDETSYYVSDCNESASGELVIPSTYNGKPVARIGDNAFNGCTGLTGVTIPDSVTNIGEYAFRECTGLTSITIPNSVTVIEHSAFGDCSSLVDITIGSGVTSIGERAFSWCTGLTNIAIPDSVSSIGRFAFIGCTSLTGIWVDEDNIVYSSDERGVLFNKDKTELIRAPQGMTGNYVIPDSVTSIFAVGAAYGGDTAFSGCTGLTSITIANGITTLGQEQFARCTGLTSITIPDGVTNIDLCAFLKCSGLINITIPDSVTSIDSSAFYECTGLTDVYYGGTEAQWTAVTIDEYGNDPLLNATIHYNYVETVEPETDMNVDRAIIRLQKQMKMGFYYEMVTEQTVLETGAIVWTAEEYAKETAFDIDHTVGKKYPGKAENTDGTYYSIETDGIPAQAIDTVLYILPYAKTANGYSYGETIKSNSILNVAKNQYNSAETAADVKAVIVDVLNYATAARIYFVAKGEMTAPAEAFNAILTDAEKALKWSDNLLAARSGVAETESEYAPATDKVYINIEDALKIQFIFADSSVTGALYWQGKDYTGSAVHDDTTATGEAYITTQNSYVSCAIRGINAYNIYDDFYVRGYNAQGQLTKTYTHSIAAYLTNQIAACEGKTDSESQALVELCKAMLIYGKSAQENDAVNKGE